MSRRVVHFEIPADDVERAREFYRAAFDWQMQPVPEMGYTLVQTTPIDEQGRPTEPGAINGGLLERHDPLSTVVITIDVDDIDATLKTVEDLGATVVRQRTAVGDMGHVAYFRDPEGNVVGLWQNA